jgi:hypothetical protein
MAIIKTDTNIVAAYDPMDADAYVEARIGNRCLPAQPIEHYNQMVKWAVSMADQFDPPLHILPITGAEYIHTNREQLERGLAAMTPSERHGLRKRMVADLARVMRDCCDPEVRAEAYAVLTKMRVVQPPATE